MFPVVIVVVSLVVHISQITASSSQKCCPMGWTAECGKCYKVFTGTMTLAEVEALCPKNGGKFVEIKSEKENELVSALAKSHGVTGFRLGFKLVDGKWISMSDGTVAPYLNWNDIEPDDCCDGVVDCVFVDLTNDNKWFDDSNREHNIVNGVVCEK